MRNMYFMVGDTATGKGLLEEAMQMSCGTFVGTFDVASFVRNTNTGADAAKQLSWLKMIADLRVAFSSEAHQGSTLDGVLVKKVVSGGDRLTMRTNHKDEEILINRATLFVLCNDVPTISPCDSAVEDRQGGVFEKDVRFVERPNTFRPDHEKKIDRSLFEGPLSEQCRLPGSLLEHFVGRLPSIQKARTRRPQECISSAASSSWGVGGQRDGAQGVARHGVRQCFGSEDTTALHQLLGDL